MKSYTTTILLKQNYIEVKRGVVYINYEREVDILTDF